MMGCGSCKLCPHTSLLMFLMSQMSSLGGAQMQPIMSETLLSPQQWGTVPLPLSSRAAGGGVGGGGILVPKIRQQSLFREAATPSKADRDGGDPLCSRMRTPVGGSEAVIQTARLWLGSASRYCRVVPIFEDELLVLVLVHDHASKSHEVLSMVSEVSGDDGPTSSRLHSWLLLPLHPPPCGPAYLSECPSYDPLSGALRQHTPNHL